jgi:hypothetical protein
MGTIRNINWTQLMPAFIVGESLSPDFQVTKLGCERLRCPCSGRRLRQSSGVAVSVRTLDPGKRLLAFRHVFGGVRMSLLGLSTGCSAGSPSWRSKDEMAAPWKLRFYLVASLSAFVALLFGLFTLPSDPIVGVLFMVGGMALLLYAVAGLCGAPLIKN